MEPIRVVQSGDLTQILRHNNAAAPAVNELEHNDLDWFIRHAHSFLVQPGEDGSVAGYLIGLDGPGVGYESLNYEWFEQRYNRFVYVDRVVVTESGRGLGTGRALYDEFASRAVSESHEVLLAEVNVRPRNEVSLLFHEAYGFVPVGEQDTEGGSKRVVMLEKRLDDGGPQRVAGNR